MDGFNIYVLLVNFNFFSSINVDDGTWTLEVNGGRGITVDPRTRYVCIEENGRVINSCSIYMLENNSL